MRELTRRFHKIRNRDLTAELGRMEREGWVRFRRDKRWELVFSVVPDLSAKLSKFAVEFEKRLKRGIGH